MNLFKKNIFGQYLLIKKWIIRILGAISHQRYHGFNELKIEGSNILRELSETNDLFLTIKLILQMLLQCFMFLTQL